MLTQVNDDSGRGLTPRPLLSFTANNTQQHVPNNRKRKTRAAGFLPFVHECDEDERWDAIMPRVVRRQISRWGTTGASTPALRSRSSPRRTPPVATASQGLSRRS